EPEYTTTPSPAARTGWPLLPAMPMPWRVGSPAANRFTSCPSAGHRQATLLRAGGWPCCGVLDGVPWRVADVDREGPERGGVDAVRGGVAAWPPDGYRRSFCPG